MASFRWPVNSAPWILRIALACCFAGHGAVALSVHEPWFAFYAAVGLGDDVARLTMPWVGALDVALAVAILAFPVRAIFVWCAFWALFTALLRPLAGGSLFDVLVRASNWGPPVALLMASAAEPLWHRARFRARPRWLVTWLATAFAFLVAGGLMVGALPADPSSASLWEWLERAGVVGVPLALAARFLERLRVKAAPS